MAGTPDEYAVHLFLSSGDREEIRFDSLQAFQQWYAKELKPNASSQGFINVPIRERQGEYMVVRPAGVIAIRVEPLFAGSVERY